MPTTLAGKKSALHVSRRRVKVRLELLNGSTFTGSFYADQRNRWGGPGRVSDRLNDESEPFIPLDLGERHIILRKTVIATVHLENEPWEAPRQASGAVELRLRIKLIGGSTVSGKVVAVLPTERSRSLDFLNGHDLSFFAIFSGEGTTTLVNLRYIENVTELVEPTTR